MTAIECYVRLSVAAVISISLNMPGRCVTSSDRPIHVSCGAYIRKHNENKDSEEYVQESCLDHRQAELLYFQRLCMRDALYI